MGDFTGRGRRRSEKWQNTSHLSEAWDGGQEEGKSSFCLSVFVFVFDLSLSRRGIFFSAGDG